jgi:hypothetical protein
MTKKNKKVTSSLPRSLKKLFPQVETSVDADYPIEVLVNQDDCDGATQLDPTNCALARAAKRDLKADAVIIGLNTSYIIRGKNAVRFATPERVQREIVSFDRNHDFEPGNYKLVPKAPTSRLGQSIQKKSKGGANKTATRKVHHSARVRILETDND